MRCEHVRRLKSVSNGWSFGCLLHKWLSENKFYEYKLMKEQKKSHQHLPLNRRNCVCTNGWYKKSTLHTERWAAKNIEKYSINQLVKCLWRVTLGQMFILYIALLRLSFLVCDVRYSRKIELSQYPNSKLLRIILHHNQHNTTNGTRQALNGKQKGNKMDYTSSPNFSKFLSMLKWESGWLDIFRSNQHKR